MATRPRCGAGMKKGKGMKGGTGCTSNPKTKSLGARLRGQNTPDYPRNGTKCLPGYVKKGNNCAMKGKKLVK